MADRGVAGLQRAAGTDFPHIVAARQRTEARLGERRANLQSLAIDRDAAIVLMGSWGRREVTSGSDDDFMVVFEGELRPDARPSVDAVAERLGGKPPGGEDLFAVQVSVTDLLGKIGRDEDSNANLTRRMLWMLESLPAAGDEVHTRGRRALLERYLSANQKDYRPPRFLLNDLIRYWRTIAVDFESKMRAREGEGWGLRNAKLRLSRKVLFAAGLLPVLDCHRHPAEAMLDFLDERISVPPLDRIADAFIDHGALDTGVRALFAYDQFLAILDDADQRGELSALTRADSAESPVFARVAELGREFEAGLLSLLFGDPELHRWVREYLIF